MTSPTQADIELAEFIIGRSVRLVDLDRITAFRLASEAQARAEGYAQGQRDMQEMAAKVAGAMSHNVALLMLVERYGQEACEHASNHLAYCEDAIRALPLKGQSDE